MVSSQFLNQNVSVPGQKSEVFHLHKSVSFFNTPRLNIRYTYPLFHQNQRHRKEVGRGDHESVFVKHFPLLRIHLFIYSFYHQYLLSIFYMSVSVSGTGYRRANKTKPSRSGRNESWGYSSRVPGSAHAAVGVCGCLRVLRNDASKYPWARYRRAL